MYQEFYRGSQLLHLPLFALLLFLGVFVGTCVWIFIVQRKSPKFRKLAMLPLEGDSNWNPRQEAHDEC